MESLPQPDPRRTLGALGERLASEHLTRAGYKVVERNWRSRRGELDIVAFDSATLVFCEVKTRVVGGGLGPEGPLESIGTGKRRRLRHLAREWLTASDAERPTAQALRFDAIGITVNRAGGLLSLEHVEGAF